MVLAVSHCALRTSDGQKGRPKQLRCAFAAEFCARPSTEPPSFCRSNAAMGWHFLSVAPAGKTGTAIWTGSSGRRMPYPSSSPRNESDVLPRLSSRDHAPTFGVGRRVPARSLRTSFLLQLLVGFAVAGDCALLDVGQLSPAPSGQCLLADSVSLDMDRRASHDLLAAAWLSPGLLPFVLFGAAKRPSLS